MSKLEKRLIIFAIVFVVVYMGAIVITLQSKPGTPHRITGIESAIPVPTKEEGRLLLAELLLPMAVLLTLSVCFILAKRRREKTYRKLDEEDVAN